MTTHSIVPPLHIAFPVFYPNPPKVGGFCCPPFDIPSSSSLKSLPLMTPHSEVYVSQSKAK
uniref:Uncharacterized protein n=1 Tax=Utricularia reniformis TaxID=192314 RepID=A0A1Y0B0W6_9LAMI|nr:hypothetical protein AEK19_MT0815 [Utricularia reniformis]ART31050.1 hypothetical protein AEK19_MT0815 [Utricularia reniformis]